jgi:hypothetical protein
LKLHRALIGNKKKHQYRYRNRPYFFLAILTSLYNTNASDISKRSNLVAMTNCCS